MAAQAWAIAARTCPFRDTPPKTPLSRTGSRDFVLVATCLIPLAHTPVISGDLTPFVVLTGDSESAAFGSKVSGAGDVNGDGFDDVVVGAFVTNGVLGRAYVFYGGSTADSVADLTLNGDPGVYFFGFSVSGAGDVNGDSFDDVIVGAHSPGNVGHAYLFLGGPVPDETADLVIHGEEAGDLFGASVAGTGDVNEDGFDDVIVGAPANDAPGSNAGRAYVFLGGSSLNVDADVIFDAEEANDYFGYSVAGAGDANGDDFNDVFVGARSNDVNDAGLAYVYYGGPGLDAIADLALTESNPFPGFAHSVSGAVDVNGDGFDEVIVGHFYGETVRVYYGIPQPDETPTPDLVLSEGVLGDFFGVTVSGAGDLNGDNYGDIMVGATGNDAGGNDAGRAYVFLGGQHPDASPDLTVSGDSSGAGFGIVSGSGDFNGDSFDDMIVGAVPPAGPGRAYIFLGGSDLAVSGQDGTGADMYALPTARLTLSPPRPNPRFGTETSLLLFTLDRSSMVHVRLHDIQGRTVARREDEFFASGAHTVSWSPGDLPSGVYCLRIEAGADVASTKWVIVR